MTMTKMSPQKSYKLRQILITLRTIFWNIRQVLFEVWCSFKYCYSFHCVRLTLCFSPYTFRYHFECSLLEQLKPFLIRKKGLCLSKKGISVKTYATVSASWLVTLWYNHCLLQLIPSLCAYWFLNINNSQKTNLK